MSVVKWVLIGLLLWPTAEIVVFILFTSVIGLAAATILMLSTSIAGLLVLRHAGLRDASRLRATLADGRVIEIASGNARLGLVCGGILLLIPGFITDLGGVIMVIPPLRRWVAAGIRARFKRARRRQNEARSIIELERDAWRPVSEHELEDHRPQRRQS
jgi:UPF0716 protein FxsA